MFLSRLMLPFVYMMTSGLAAATAQLPRTNDKAPKERNWQRVDLHPFDLADTLGTIRDGLGKGWRNIVLSVGKFTRLLSLPRATGGVQPPFDENDSPFDPSSFDGRRTGRAGKRRRAPAEKCDPFLVVSAHE